MESSRHRKGEMTGFDSGYLIRRNGIQGLKWSNRVLGKILRCSSQQMQQLVERVRQVADRRS